jgi:hypothetical protein
MWLAIVASAEARLGETAAQLEARYGKPTKTIVGKGGPGNGVLMFQKQDIEIEATVYGSVATYICYRKKTGFTEEQLQEMLGRNAEGAKWGTPTENTDKTNWKNSWVKHWLRDDGGKAKLSYYREEKTQKDCWALHFIAGNANEGVKQGTKRAKDEIDGL